MSGNCDTGLAAKLDKLDISEQPGDQKPAQVKKRTGLVYDERMKKHSNIWDKDHMEVPDRVGRPFNKHVEYGLLERCYRIPSRFATEDELSTFHSKEHIEKMKSTQGMKTRDLFILGEEFDSIYMSEVSGQLKAVHDKKDGKTKEYLTQLGDKYESDYLSEGHCDITPEGYCHLTNMLMSLAGGKVVIILEGGYNLTSVEESMCSCTSTLLGDPCPRLEEGPLLPSKWYANI